MKAKETAAALENEVSKVIIGKAQQIKLITMAVFSGGHVLLDDLPGSGKTTLIKAFSKALGCSFGRVQFTPDLLPSDILGMTIYDRKTDEFRLVKGPVFTNILLADEINRAIPRTQSALLEAMEERQVTIDNSSLKLPEPFFVMATQNPVERESTFELPAAQMDRFFVRLSLGFPTREEEQQMLSSTSDRFSDEDINVVSSPADLIEIGKEIDNVFVSDNVMKYIVELVHATRECDCLKAGGSPRASRFLLRGGKTYAAIMGRDYVIPEDIAEIFLPVLAHRVVLTNEAKYTKKTAEEILTELLASVPVPPTGEGIFNGEKAR